MALRVTESCPDRGYGEPGAFVSRATLVLTNDDVPAKPGRSVWRLVRVRARDVDGQSRRPFSHRRSKPDQPPLGVAAMDLLRARIQESPARRLGPLLHRTVLSRRGDGVRRRSPALLRMPPQGCGTFCRCCSPARQARIAPAMDEALHAERLDGKAKRIHRRKIDTLPDGAMIALDGEVFAVRGKRLSALDAFGICRGAAAPARHRGRRADAAVDPCRARAGYPPLWHPSAG